jgi:hypothetical protein
MAARLIDDPVQWDRFVEDSADSTLFHKWGFLELMERYTGYKMLPYGIFLEDDMVAAIPFFLNSEYGLKLLYSPPPTSMVYVHYLGLATAPWIKELRQREREEVWKYIIGELGRMVGHMSPNYVTISLMPGMDAGPLSGAVLTQSLNIHTLSTWSSRSRRYGAAWKVIVEKRSMMSQKNRSPSKGHMMSTCSAIS